MNVAKFEQHEYIADLKKQLTTMQNDRIIIDQKLRIAETKLKEYEERNQNINRMNGTIMNVLNDLNSNQQNASEYQKSIDVQNIKIIQLQDKIKQLEQNNKSLTLQLQEATIHKSEQQHQLQDVAEQVQAYLKTIGALESQEQQHCILVDQLHNQIEQLQNELEECQFGMQKLKFEQDVKMEELIDENESLKEELKSIMNRYLKSAQPYISSMHTSPIQQKQQIREQNSSDIKISIKPNSVQAIRPWKPILQKPITNTTTPIKKWK